MLKHMLIFSITAYYCVQVFMDYRKWLIYGMIFFRKYILRYNASRALPICYAKSGRQSLHFNGECIGWEASVEYLENINCSSMTNCNDVTYKKRIYISSVKKLNCKFVFASKSTGGKIVTELLFRFVWKPNLAARYRRKLQRSIDSILV